MQKRFIALLLTFAMVFALLAGCGNTTNEEPNAATQGQSSSSENQEATPTENEEVPAEPITITVGVPELGKGWPATVEEDFVHTAILEATNVDVQFVPIDDYYTALNVQLTGGTAPDFFQADYDNMKAYVSQELIKPIDDYKADIASVIEYLGADYDNYTLYVDDEMYAFPYGSAGTPRYYGIYVRQDFLDALGCEAPTTVDELYDFCVTAMEKNLSGLGNTIPLGGKGWYPYDMIASTYGVHLGNYVIIEDGKVTNTLLNENMENALTAVKRFYDAGLIDPDTFNGGTGGEHMRTGYVAIGSNQWVPIWKQAYLNILAEVNPNASWALVDPLQSNIGTGSEPFGMVDYNSNNTAKYVVNYDTSDEKIAAFVKVLNYLATEEGKMVSWMGIQGTHWDYDDTGKAVILEGMADLVNYVSTYQMIGRNDQEYLTLKFPEASEAIAYGNEMERCTKYNDALDVPETFYLDDMETYVTDQLFAFIKGDRPISEYRDFVQELYNVYDLQSYMDLATEQLTSMGLVK